MVLFVGHKPSPKMKPGAAPFEGAACEPRFRDWLDIMDTPPMRYIMNSTDAETLNMALMFVQCGGKVVALGNEASKALGKIPHFKLPHPSGRNRQINDALFIKTKLAECKEYMCAEYI
jgi:hypothetical protein